MNTIYTEEKDSVSFDILIKQAEENNVRRDTDIQKAGKSAYSKFRESPKHMIKIQTGEVKINQSSRGHKPSLQVPNPDLERGSILQKYKSQAKGEDMAEPLLSDSQTIKQSKGKEVIGKLKNWFRREDQKPKLTSSLRYNDGSVDLSNRSQMKQSQDDVSNRGIAPDVEVYIEDSGKQGEQKSRAGDKGSGGEVFNEQRMAKLIPLPRFLITVEEFNETIDPQFKKF